MSDAPRYIHCVPYTPAKRHAPMIGSVWGYEGWPLPVTVFQFAAGFVSILALALTYRWWGVFGMGNILVFPAVVLGALFLTRQIRIEGRSPWAAGLGLAGSVVGRTRLNGGKHRERTVVKIRPAKVLLVPGPGWKHLPLAVVVSHTDGRTHRRIRRDYWARAESLHHRRPRHVASRSEA